MKRSAFMLACLLLILTTGVALAHKPIFVSPGANVQRERAIQIPNPDVSWAVYAQLSEPGEVNYYTFTGRRGAPVEISMSLPQIATLADFGVSVALLGPGLPEGAALPIALLGMEGAVVVPDSAHDRRAIFDEPFTQTSYWTRQTLRITVPADASYTIAVFDPSGRAGKYVLAIGQREEFGAQDVATFAAVRARVRRWFDQPLDSASTWRASAEGASGLNASAILVIAAPLIVLGGGSAVAAWMRRVRKKKRGKTWDES